LGRANRVASEWSAIGCGGKGWIAVVFGLLYLSAAARGLAESPAASGSEAQPPFSLASSGVPTDHLRQYSDLAVTWMQDYLRIDTTNPPGHEMRAVEFYKKILDQEGIENRAFEYAPGRGDLWGRLPHTAAEAKRPLILLNHMDVVTSDASHWKVRRSAGNRGRIDLGPRGAGHEGRRPGAVHGRMVMLKREKVELDRDVIFLAVSDEEVDGTGSGLVYRT
jgi:hypothetical protein